MVMDLNRLGHTPTYIRYVAEGWCARKPEGTLTFVVSDKFHALHPEIVGLAETTEGLKFIEITLQERAILRQAKAGAPLLFRDVLTRKIPEATREFKLWELVNAYAMRLGATHCFLLTMDAYAPFLAAGLAMQAPFSGLIHLTPDFAGPPHTLTQQKFVFARLLKHPQLLKIFYFGPRDLSARFPDAKSKLVHLPTPTPTYHATADEHEALRKELGVEAGRRVFLLFGYLSGAKGVFKLVEALARLSPATAARMCLIVAGTSGEQDIARLREGLEAVRESLPLQVVERYEFIPEVKVPAYLEAADVIVAPHQKLSGASGMLVLAAAAQKPTVGSEYGYIGEMMREYALGLAVDTTQPLEIAHALTRCVNEDLGSLADADKMKLFAAENSADRFAGMILEEMGGVEG